ncbi:MAG TPA: hypothetical protein DD417_12825 [Elusimicrobia bacterium]|nr:hypothetical protein [Elusimicrobiota bacterium]
MYNRRMMNRGLFLALLAVLAGLGMSCRRGAEDIVARVGNVTITQVEFREKLAEVSPDYQSYVLTPYGRRQFLQVLIREKLILEAAQAEGVPSLPEFKDRMDRLRKEEEEKLAEARDYLLARLWLDQLRDRGVISVTDEEIKDYHRKHPIELSASHILLATSEDAEEVLGKVRSGGSFAALAKAHSLDADTAHQGGRMRPALYGEVIPELEVLFSMKLGELGGPVKSTFGYHVLWKEKEAPVPFEPVADRLRLVVEKEKLDKHLKSLQASFRVEVLDAQFK